MIGSKSGRVYLYLARRDKTAVKILAILNGNPRSGRVIDLNKLGLPESIKGEIEKVCYENRMYWEPWVEPAATFQELAKKLTARGFNGLPMGGQPIVTFLPGQNINTTPVAHKPTMVRPKRQS